MNDRYIDISSGYRNRKQFPLPSQFNVLFSDSGDRTTITSAFDPYSTAAAIFPPTNLDSGDSYSSEFYITTTPAALPNTYQIDGVVVNGNTIINPNSADNFYVGNVLEFGEETRTIRSYMVSDQDTVYHNGTIVSATDETTFIIQNGTGLADRSDIDDYYVGKSVTVGSEMRTIVDYVGASGTVVVYPPFPSVPTGTARIIGPTFLVELDSDFGTAPTSTIPVLSPPDLARIRGSEPTQYGSGVSITAASTSTIPIGTGLSDIFTGNFIHLWNDSDSTSSQYVEVTAYDSTTGNLTVTPSLTTGAGTYDYAVIPFSGDNHHALNYTGSRVSNQQAVCHEVSLVSLTLPNLLLKSGGKIAFKPYVYVELTNLTSRAPNHIWSNNPNASHSLFKVSINDDISLPSENPFVTLLCQCMTQTINFKPNDNFRFAIRLPDGELFEVSEAESFSPSPPNSSIQIDALFKVRKVC